MAGATGSRFSTLTSDRLLLLPTSIAHTFAERGLRYVPGHRMLKPGQTVEDLWSEKDVLEGK